MAHNKYQSLIEQGKAWANLKPELPPSSVDATAKMARRQDKRIGEKKRKRDNRFVHHHPAAEAEAIRAKIKESGLRPAQFWAAAALGLRIPRSVKKNTANKLAVWHLRKIGGNINQQTKLAHRAGQAPEREVLEATHALIKAAIAGLEPR